MLSFPNSRRRRRGGLARPPSRFVHLHLEELETRAVPAAMGVSFFPGPQSTDFNNVFTFTPTPVNTAGPSTFLLQQTMGSALVTYGTQSVPGFASLYPVANGFFTPTFLQGPTNYEALLFNSAVPLLAPYYVYATGLTTPVELSTVFIPTPGPRGLPLSTPAPLPILDAAHYQMLRFLNPYTNPTDTLAWTNQIYLTHRTFDVGGAGDNLFQGPTTPANNEAAPTEENLLEYIRVLGDARPVHPAANHAQPAVEQPAPAKTEKETPRVEPARPAATTEEPAVSMEQKATADAVVFWTVKTPDELFWDTRFDSSDLPAPVLDSWAPAVNALAVASVSDGGDGDDADA